MYDSWKKWFVKWMAVVLTVVMGMGLCAGFPVGAAYENTHTNTGNQRADIVAIAQTQVGYREGSLDGTTSGSNNYTKYNVDLYKIDGSYCYAWCQSFIAWCAKQAGVSSSVIKRTAGTIDAMDFFKSQQVWQGNSYTPQSGDIIYFRSSSSNSGYHVGIVESVSGSTIYTIEGNYSNKVARHSVSVGASSIVGYGVPNYEGVTPPDPPMSATLSENQIWYDIKDTIVLTVTADNATNYFLSITKDGVPVVQGIEIFGTYSIAASNLGYGNYHAWASVANSAGSMDTNGIDFSVVGAATYTDVSVSKEVYSVNDIVTISVSTICAKGQVIGIDKNNITRIITESCDSTYQVSAQQLGIGKYSAYFSVYNGSGGVDTKRVEFYICDTDVNHDGNFNDSDTLLLQDYLLGRSVLTNDQKQQADLNQDGVIDGFDLALLKHLLLASE